MKRSWPRRVLLGVLAIVIALVMGEVLVKLVAPQVSLHPRWEYCPAYGHISYPDCQMVHRRANQWRFVYTVNRNRCRGDVIPLSNTYVKTNVVVLGDSYTFGEGVQDGDEYPTVLAATLGSDYNVVNLGCPGWGLTQQIRRFYEFGQLYEPAVVVLQFCANDPMENFINLVTVVKNGRFQFRDSKTRLGYLGQWLSRSFLQKSELYNLVRQRLYWPLKKLKVRFGKRRYYGNEEADEAGMYAELLEVFARDLQRRGIRLHMISVTDQLEKFTPITKRIEALEQEGCLEFLDTNEWLEGRTDFGSPEGHEWGRAAHAVVGERLAGCIRVGEPFLDR